MVTVSGVSGSPRRSLALMRAQSGRLLLMVVLLQLIMGLTQVPLIGLLLLLSVPALTAGLLQGFHVTALGGRPAPSLLFVPLTSKGHAGRLFGLGAVMFLVGITCVALLLPADSMLTDPELISRIEQGDTEALAALDEQPLPDRDFDWSVVAATLREPTARTLEQLDAWAVTLFDAEVRTIARAVLAAVVSADPGVFKRSARTDSLAAAILAYLQSSIPARLDRDERQQLVWSARNQSVLAAATGVSASSLSSRSKTVANVLDRAPIDWPRFLHSVQRAELITARDLIATHRSRS